jgi:undecaprenyl diphosphate synthase
VAVPEAGIPLARPTDAPPIAHARAAQWGGATVEGATARPAAARSAGAGSTAAGPIGAASIAEESPSARSAIVGSPVDTDEQPRSELPVHVAIIMDGNRRWARERGLPELDGHAAGVEAIRNVLRHAVRRGVAYLTLYAFSRENWARSDEEVSGLFGLLQETIGRETDELREQGVRVHVLGRLAELPADTRSSVQTALEETAAGARLTLNIAFNYAGRTELVDAFRRLAASGMDPDDIDEAAIAGALYTAGQPDPDLVIRTGGEQRLSNFLIWQSAYAELYTCDVLWPDFGPETFDAALLEFARRTRRFGR